MPIPNYVLNLDGSLSAFTQPQVNTLRLDWTRGIRDGSSPRRQGNQTEETLVHKTLTPPTLVDDTICYLMGMTKAYTSLIDGMLHLSRISPQGYPGMSWLRGSGLSSNTWMKFVDNETEGAQYPKPTYTWAETEWMFQTFPFNFATDAEVEDATGVDGGIGEGIRYLQELPTQQFSEYLTYPALGLKYVKVGGGRPDGSQVGFNNGFPLVNSIVSRKWYRIPRECFTQGSALYLRLFGDDNRTVKPYVGTINMYNFLGYPPGTLLLLPPESEVVYDQASSQYCYNITYKFKYNPFGHNYLLYFDFGGPDPMAPTKFTGFYYVSNDGNFYAPTDPLGENRSIFNYRDFGMVTGYGGIFAVGTGNH